MSNIFLIAAILIASFFFISVLLFSSWWQIYTKANKKGWAILLPIYNVLIMCSIAKKPWWWIFLLMIPGVNIVLYIIILYNISKNFSKNHFFTAGMVLLPFVFIPILAFGNAIYIDNAIV
ncbi:MAG: DUF5684 domain-containing protein [Bacteroidota bacterium]